VEASSVVSLDNVAAIDLVGTNTAVVGSLGSGETVLGPSEGVHVLVQEGVFLFDSEPGLLVLGFLHDFIAALSVVGLCWLLVVFVGLAEDQLVVVQPEGVCVDGNGVEVGVRVLALSLTGAAAVEVPDGKLLWVFWDEVQCPGLGSEVLTGTIDPDIHSLGLAGLLDAQTEELVHDGFVEGSVESHRGLGLKTVEYVDR